MTDKRLFNIGHVKLPYEERDVAHRHLDEGDFIEQYAETADVGELGRYAAWLTDEAAEEYMQASNARYVEPAQRIHKKDFPHDEVSADVLALQKHGVEREALEFCGFFGSDLRKGAPVCVLDTGYGSSLYADPRLIEKWNFTDSPTADDVDGHGTWCFHCAVPYFGSGISAKVLGDDGSGWDSWGIAAVDRFVTYCNRNNTNGVVTASLGGDHRSRGYDEAGWRAVRYGIYLVAAAGNEAYRDKISTPAAEASWLSVGAVDHRDGSIADFSNRTADGAEPEIYAPGVNVHGEGAGGWNGTSMATPFVARAASQLIFLDGIGPVRVRQALHEGARLKDRYHGAGILTVTESAKIVRGLV